MYVCSLAEKVCEKALKTTTKMVQPMQSNKNKVDFSDDTKDYFNLSEVNGADLFLLLE